MACPHTIHIHAYIHTYIHTNKTHQITWFTANVHKQILTAMLHVATILMTPFPNAVIAIQMITVVSSSSDLSDAVYVANIAP